MTTHYTAAEVDAAHEFAWHNRDGVAGSGSQRAAMQLLDKIAPAIAARALREAAGWVSDLFAPDADLYAGDMVSMLERRADEIEKGQS